MQLHSDEFGKGMNSRGEGEGGGGGGLNCSRTALNDAAFA